ncbi:hypothetical protein VCR12J2_620404 [Vibrio coralliirubri]|nr:hypothetical protein VCR12J2_620404 [Vibrio coralliirubri]
MIFCSQTSVINYWSQIPLTRSHTGRKETINLQIDTGKYGYDTTACIGGRQFRQEDPQHHTRLK